MTNQNYKDLLNQAIDDLAEEKAKKKVNQKKQDLIQDTVDWLEGKFHWKCTEDGVLWVFEDGIYIDGNQKIRKEIQDYCKKEALP